MTIPAESSKADLRRDQVLRAAAECFQKDGFHRSSMSKISARAGMSSGHIYHYFARKEDIVAGLVSRAESELEGVVSAVKGRAVFSDVINAVVEETVNNASRYLSDGSAGLTMEILAEAARNEEIASQVARSDEEVRRAFYELLGGESPEIASRCEIVAALLDGLQARSIRNPAMKTTLDLELLKQVLRVTLSPSER